jgi:hypothetical protein
MIKKIFSALVLLVVFMACLPKGEAEAARGAPGSSEFGIGGTIQLDGQFVEDGLHLATSLQMDWIAVELSWQAAQPDKGGTANLSSLDAVLDFASRSKIAVMISLTQPPAWSLTATGPDAAAAAKFIQQLVQRPNRTPQAIELFPGANTRAGWGARPDPKAYLALYTAVQATLKSIKNSTILVGAGLRPVVSASTDQMDDVVFLSALYQAGARSTIPIISIQLGAPSGLPTTAPSSQQRQVLRHYEEIRDVMVKAGHEQGLVWITDLQPPSSGASTGDASQSAWFNQVYTQLRSQLYLGVTFFASINPGKTAFSLITPAGEFHQAYRAFRDLIVQNASGSLSSRPGRAKETPLTRSK